MYNTTDDDFLKSVLFVFLNKTCFRGLYREGKNGFNVPYGNNKNPSIFNEEQILYLSQLFNKHNVHFNHLSFDKLLIKPNAFLYLDPPYVPIDKSSFVDYMNGGFNHIEMVKWCEKVVSINGVKMLHSNSYCDFVIKNYSNFNIDIIECKRLINSKNPNSKCNEVLIKN